MAQKNQCNKPTGLWVKRNLLSSPRSCTDVNSPGLNDSCNLVPLLIEVITTGELPMLTQTGDIVTDCVETITNDTGWISLLNPPGIIKFLTDIDCPDGILIDYIVSITDGVNFDMLTITNQTPTVPGVSIATNAIGQTYYSANGIPFLDVDTGSFANIPVTICFDSITTNCGTTLLNNQCLTFGDAS